MGWANCRFQEETDCSETGSVDYHVNVGNLGVVLNVPSMWEHYATEHLVQPTAREREVVMDADPSTVSGRRRLTRSLHQQETVKILYVERTDSGYTHDVGTEPDTEFIDKLELILSKVN